MPERPSFNPDATAEHERHEKLTQAFEHLASAHDILAALPDESNGSKQVVQELVGTATNFLTEYTASNNTDDLQERAATSLITLVNRFDPRRRVPYRVPEDTEPNA